MTVFALLINGLFLKFAKTLGIRNSSETVIRWGSLSKPAMGGISFYIIFIMSIVFYSIFFTENNVFKNAQILGLLASTTIAFLMGLADDAYNTKPVLKFLVQLFCAFILIYSGIYIKISNNDFFNYAITIFWVTGIMNSINMLDNMDAITTVVSIMILIICLLVMYVNQLTSNIHVMIIIGVISALLGFLYYNWYPSKIYMGDTGSQFLGAFLAAIGIIFLWNMGSDYVQVKALSSQRQFLITILAFIIPISDTTIVVFNRIKKGNSPFVGGKDHTTHSLFYNGITERRIAVLFAFITTISAFFIYLIVHVITEWSILHFLLFSLYFLVVFSLLYRSTIKRK